MSKVAIFAAVFAAGALAVVGGFKIAEGILSARGLADEDEGCLDDCADCNGGRCMNACGCRRRSENEPAYGGDTDDTSD